MASNIRTQFLKLKNYNRYLLRRKLSHTSVLLNNPAPEPSEKPLSIPQPDGSAKVYSPKLEQIFQSISQLSLLEVAELSQLLKTRLNLPDAPAMSFAPIHGPAMGAKEEEVEAVAKTDYSVKILSFDPNKKVALIKELKTLMPDLNLVQAKKLIESAPVVVLKDKGKTDAEKCHDALKQAGAEVEII